MAFSTPFYRVFVFFFIGWGLLLAAPAEAQNLPATPSMAINVEGVSDWSTEQAFINVARTARPWFGHLEDQWGGISNEQLRATGMVNKNGWPVAIPENATKLETVFFTDQPAELHSIRGRYRVTYDGDVDAYISGPAKNVTYGDHEIWFDYPENAGGTVGFGLTRINPDVPMTHLEIVHEKNIPAFELGAIFNPLWLNRVKDFRVIRFMPWMGINDSDVETWDDLPTEKVFTYVQGVPLSVMIKLSNLIAVDPWFSLPHKSDDDLVKRYAEQIKRDLAPNRKAYIEYSNELWNFQFGQAHWAADQAKALWKWRAGGDAWIQYAGLRAAQIAKIFKTTFGDDADTRLKNVIGVHTGWVDLAEAQLDGKLLRREIKDKPSELFDAYAVTGYFTLDLEQGKMTETLNKWLDDGGEANAFAKLDEQIRATRLNFLRTDAWPRHAARAKKYGMDLIMYEGGTHLILPYNEDVDDRLLKLLEDFNYGPEMAAIYKDAFQYWRDAGGNLFNAFVEISQPSRWGSWGLLRHVDDSTARWDVVSEWNKHPSGYERDRNPEDFAKGVLTPPVEPHMIGTDHDDILIGSDADEAFSPGLGHDLVHGGGGFDQLMLKGDIADFEISKSGDVFQLSSSKQNIRFAGIEYLVFPESGFAISPEDM